MVESHPYLLRTCDACGALLNEDEASTGLLVWSRGGQVEYEEPGLCRQCGHAIGMTALFRFAAEEDGG